MADQQRLKSNIPKVLALNFFYMFLVIMPVIVPFWQSKNLSMTEIYLLQAVFAISVFILEVPSGYIADLIGRKQSIVIAGLFSGIAWFVFMNSESFWGFVVFEILIAVGTSLISGSDVALIYDSIELMENKPYNENRVLGRKIFYSQIGETIAALLGGAAAVYSLNLPAQINAVTAWGVFFIGITIYEPPRQKMDAQKHSDNIRYIYKSLFKHSRLLNFILLNLIFYGIATLLAVWSFQAYWQAEAISIAHFGYLWAGYNLTVALVGRVAHQFEKQLGTVAVIMLIALLPVVGYFGMAFASGWLGVVFGFGFQISRGLSQVVLRDALNKRVTADMRATANSVASLGVRFLFVLIGPLMGWGLDSVGFETTYAVLAGFFLVLFFIICLPLIALRKEFTIS